VGVALAALLVALAAGDATEPATLTVGLPAEARSAEAGGFMKVQPVYLRMPAVYERGGLPREAWLATQTARAWVRWDPRASVTLQAAWQLEGVVASDPRFAMTAGPVPLSGGSGQGAKRRLVDFDGELAAGGGMRLRHNVDQLAAAWHAPWGDLTVGRQVLSWGSGRFWNPTDLLSPFAPTDIDKEVRHGVDALRATVPLSPTAQVDGLWLPQQAGRDNGGVLRAQVNVAGFDVVPSAAKYVRDTVAGLDLTGDAGPAGVHAEAAWTRALDVDARGRRDNFVRAVAGAEGRPLDALVILGEYYFNGWGAKRPAEYLAVRESSRVERGEVFGAGRHYLGLSAAWLASELVTLQAAVTVNLQDPSAMAVPMVEVWAAQEVLVRAGGYVPLGAAPQMGYGLEVRSEYGASPAGAFVQLGIYAQ
jgi:hypothetical protein